MSEPNDLHSVPNERQRSDTVLKVGSQSMPTKVAGAIAAVLRQYEVVEVQAIGPGAVNQAVKSIAIARQYLREEQVELVCVPGFVDVVVAGDERTAIRFIVERRLL